MLALLLALVASAADLPDPTVTIEDDGTIVGTVHLAVSPDKVRTAMADPGWMAKLTGGRTKVTVEGKDGDCLLVASESPNSIMTARYWTRRCPTPTGYAATLRDSNCFKTYGASWDFTEHASGAVGTYRISLTTSLWIPNSVVLNKTSAAIQDMLADLQQWSKNPG